MALSASPRNIFRSFQFAVEIDGIQGARFQEVSGIEASSEMIEYREGGDPLHSRKLPGMAKFSNLTLKRGYSSDDQLWKWFESIVNGQAANLRRNISVVQLDMSGQEVFRWNLFQAFPVKYTAASYNASGNALAIEAVELAYDRMEMSKS